MAEMDAIELLLHDHREVEHIFDELAPAAKKADIPTGDGAKGGGAKGDGNQKSMANKERLAQKLIAELTVHAKVEEELVYPAIRSAVPEENEQVDEGISEHGQVKELLAQLEGLTPGDKEFDRLMSELKENVEHHVHEEETEVLPKFREAVSRTDLKKLGKKAAELKEHAMAAQMADLEEPASGSGEKASAPSRGSSKGKGTEGKAKDDLIDLPKEELYERARQAGISGRSKMSTEELVEALRQNR